MRFTVLCLAAVTLLCPLVRADNAITPGRLIVEPPTLICLGFELEFTGDDNRNATVETRYRKAGESSWRDALPLLRMGGERVFRAREQLDYTVPHRFAGSILDLDENTGYEVRFTVQDPDGVGGEGVHTAKVSTRAEPKAAEGGRVLHVYPPAWRGQKQEPAFVGLKAAYYGSGNGDWSVVTERKAQPGDVILVHAGLYKADRFDYVNPLGIPFDGTYVLTLKGTPRAAHRHPRRRRRRTHLRRQRRASAVRRQRHRPPHL